MLVDAIAGRMSDSRGRLVRSLSKIPIIIGHPWGMFPLVSNSGNSSQYRLRAITGDRISNASNVISSLTLVCTRTCFPATFA